MDQININHQSKNSIDVMGISGKFITPDSKFRIKYFSTYANKNESHHKHLLDELMPMRERINTSEIHDISSLLQRDLDDLRVSGSLIPYLKNQIRNISDTNHIAFFPAILAVLIPKDFIKNNKDDSLNYPYFHELEVTQLNQKIDRVDYVSNFDNNDEDFYWRLDKYKNSRLGQLKIDNEKTSIVVLDGQHRSNAFRVLTDSFFENQKNDTYKVFYDREQVIPDYDSDLPVTIIWFERLDQAEKEDIKPTVISRDLFIAVNDNAKQISHGRKILLNDKAPSSLLTKFFFSKIALTNSFDCTKNQLTLLHMGFDINTDLRNHTSHKFTLTTPEIIEFTMDWMFFGNRRYCKIKNVDSLNKIYKVPSERKRLEYVTFDELLIEASGQVEVTENEYNEKSKRLKEGADVELSLRDSVS